MKQKKKLSEIFSVFFPFVRYFRYAFVSLKIIPLFRLEICTNVFVWRNFWEKIEQQNKQHIGVVVLGSRSDQNRSNQRKKTDENWKLEIGKFVQRRLILKSSTKNKNLIEWKKKQKKILSENWIVSAIIRI